MKTLKKTAGNIRNIRETQQSLVFYWIFNPDGSVIDHSNGNYLSLLENSYKSSTSSEGYLGRQ